VGVVSAPLRRAPAAEQLLQREVWNGAAQDDQIYKFASDVFADQSIEIERMNKMLADGGGTPR
jgi:hypothetical protein